jgi:hypothetical protein
LADVPSVKMKRAARDRGFLIAWKQPAASYLLLMDIGHLLFWAEFVNRFHTKEAGEGPSTTAKFPSLRGSKIQVR